MTQGLRKCPHQIRGGKCGCGERRGEKVLADNRSLHNTSPPVILRRLLVAGFFGDVIVNGVDSG
jgi:hypothetical protein